VKIFEDRLHLNVQEMRDDEPPPTDVATVVEAPFPDDIEPADLEWYATVQLTAEVFAGEGTLYADDGMRARVVSATVALLVKQLSDQDRGGLVAILAVKLSEESRARLVARLSTSLPNDHQQKIATGLIKLQSPENRLTWIKKVAADYLSGNMTPESSCHSEVNDTG